MKKFVVLEKTGNCEFTVEKSFSELQDAIEYKRLLEKSNEFETTTYHVSAIL